MIDNGKTLQVAFRVEDPDTFYEPWSALINFRRAQRPMHQEACAESNTCSTIISRWQQG